MSKYEKYEKERNSERSRNKYLDKEEKYKSRYRDDKYNSYRDSRNLNYGRYGILK